MNRKSVLVKLLLLCGLLAAIFMSGCNSQGVANLKKSTPIISIKEYEKLLLGKLTADYVGNENCLKGCHDHDKKALDFKASTMGDQLIQSSSGMMIVDCESCHGPGSELMDAIKGLDAIKDVKEIIRAHAENLLDFKSLPAGAMSLICLKCHTANATFNIHNWNGSVHAGNEVSCSSCHPIHGSSDLILPPRETSEACMGCHIEIRASFSLPSHHPVKEGKIFCTDCHEPHGNENPNQLKRMTQRETCGRCHTEKTGPFLYEHADNTEDCAICHSPHGSINKSMLKLPVTFLCKQCHANHRNTIGADATVNLANSSMTYTRCTDCHSSIHGSDTPGANSGRALTR